MCVSVLASFFCVFVCLCVCVCVSVTVSLSMTVSVIVCSHVYTFCFLVYEATF